jgi:uncharacterized coiled-coil protein SlyX
MTAPEAIEVRIVRLESDTAYVLSKAADLKLDVREIRSEISDLREQMRRELAALRAEIRGLRNPLRM